MPLYTSSELVERAASAARRHVIKFQVKKKLEINETSPDTSFSFVDGFVMHRALQCILEQTIKKIVENTQTTSCEAIEQILHQYQWPIDGFMKTFVI